MTGNWRLEELGRTSRGVLVAHAEAAEELEQARTAACELAARELDARGALLFRGLEVGEGVYTSTEYPQHRSIPLHSEQSYSRNWPMNILFYCVRGRAARCDDA